VVRGGPNACSAAARSPARRNASRARAEFVSHVVAAAPSSSSAHA
jgi:hypothetical protein